MSGGSKITLESMNSYWAFDKTLRWKDIEMVSQRMPHCKSLYYTTPNLPTNIMDFRGFDSRIILMLGVGIPRPKWDFPEMLSQAIVVGIMLVGRLGVY